MRRLNIDGDGQGDLAGHGGEHRAVFVYQIESYRYWQEQLGRDDFSYGQFGENFTVGGLADDQVCIGDRYRIGEAEFEVTQPRVTCYRVGIRMDDPRMPALLVSHHRPGFYFRVLREGAVQAGDEIVQVAAGPEAMTVAEVDALLYLPGHTRERVQRALRIPALPDGWRASFRALLDQPEPGGAGGQRRADRGEPAAGLAGFPPAGGDRGGAGRATRWCRCTWPIPAGRAVPPALPGQFLTLRLPAGPDGAAAAAQLLAVRARRAPTPTGSASSASRTARAASSCTTEVRAGDLLEVAAPRGTFILQPGDDAGPADQRGRRGDPGAGHAARPGGRGSGRDVWWLHGARSRAEEPFAAEARSLLAGLASGHRHVCYSRPGARDVEGRDYQTRGAAVGVGAGRARPSARRRRVHLRPGRVHGRDVRRPGRPGYRRRRVRTEIFGAAPAQTPGIAAAAARPPHPPGGRARRRPAGRVRAQRPDGPLGPGLRPACSSWPKPATCRCAGRAAPASATPARPRLLSGTVSYAPDPVDDPADGSALICCSQPRGDLVLDL